MIWLAGCTAMCTEAFTVLCAGDLHCWAGPGKGVFGRCTCSTANRSPPLFSRSSQVISYRLVHTRKCVWVGGLLEGVYGHSYVLFRVLAVSLPISPQGCWAGFRVWVQVEGGRCAVCAAEQSQHHASSDVLALASACFLVPEQGHALWRQSLSCSAFVLLWSPS
jgi:hypothetical protein